MEGKVDARSGTGVALGPRSAEHGGRDLGIAFQNLANPLDGLFRQAECHVRPRFPGRCRRPLSESLRAAVAAPERAGRKRPAPHGRFLRPPPRCICFNHSLTGQKSMPARSRRFGPSPTGIPLVPQSTTFSRWRPTATAPGRVAKSIKYSRKPSKFKATNRSPFTPKSARGGRAKSRHGRSTDAGSRHLHIPGGDESSDRRPLLPAAP